MDFQEVLRKRRMVRAFTTQPIESEKRDRVLHALTRGPSAGFSQGFGFLVLEDADAERFWDVAWPISERTGIHTGTTNARLVIIPAADKQAYLDRYAEPDKGWTDKSETRWPVPFWITDTAFAAMLALLAVVDEGLGALYFGLMHEPEVRAAFGIPDSVTPIGAIAVGYPAADTPSPSLRRGQRDDLIRFGKW